MANQRLPPISEGTYLRAAAADPNEQRCLVENFPVERGIQVAHILPRSVVREEATMSSLEWNWNLRRGTLNLDTRENVCFLGASMKLLYENNQWGLLPEEHIIDEYYDKKSAGFGCPRSGFPVIAGDTFTYTLVALTGMENLALMRQIKHPAQANGFETHLHPFQQFPKIVSHIHPRFAIMALARSARTVRSPGLRDVCQIFPSIKKLMIVASSWTRMLPPENILEEDPTYMDPEVVAASRDDDDDETFEGYETDGDSICTVPRRMLYVRPPPATKRQRNQEEYEDESDDDRPPPKARRTDERSSCPESSGESAWTADRIAQWAKECCRTPPP
ncbi:hypothetical protein BKA70DRAFT_1440579 [Coprinopsis sp. MPI-PUGE-AT-0042]|nr:hypothetical protein BKA70DRAFT_1440579 [Coprinopsis sp. MPI-PUGE-AT-0042]